MPTFSRSACGINSLDDFFRRKISCIGCIPRIRRIILVTVRWICILNIWPINLINVWAHCNGYRFLKSHIVFHWGINWIHLITFMTVKLNLWNTWIRTDSETIPLQSDSLCELMEDTEKMPTQLSRVDWKNNGDYPHTWNIQHAIWVCAGVCCARWLAQIKMSVSYLE